MRESQKMIVRTMYNEQQHSKRKFRITRITWRDLLSLWLCYRSGCGFNGQAQVAAASLERTALVSLFQSTTSMRTSSWTNDTGWSTIDSSQSWPICSWFGVECLDWNTGGRTTTADEGVVALRLPDNNLISSIPMDFWKNLPNLQALDLSQNFITKLEFADTGANVRLPPLQVLDLSSCFLQALPGLEGLAATLIEIKLSNNQFQTFPTALFALTKLERLFINNAVTTPGPLNGSNLASWRDHLVEFYAYSNSFTGTLPTELGLLTQLQALSFSSNAFHGFIPTQLNALTNLQVLSLNGGGTADTSTHGTTVGMSLTGRVPSFANLTRLTKLFLSENQLTGPLPADFLKFSAAATSNTNNNNNSPLSSMVIVNLQNNYLTGGVPLGLRQFADLHLNLVGNLLTQPIPDFFCTKARWMHGLVALYGCNAILCPAGTFSAQGQQLSDDTACQKCPSSNGPNTTYYLGATSCPKSSSNNGDNNDPADTTRSLFQFYRALDGPRWENNDGWEIFDTIATNSGSNLNSISIGPVDFCQFYGVLCDGGGNVLFITLANNRLQGTLPTSKLWKGLPKLASLDLSFNGGLEVLDWAGPLPESLARLKFSHTSVRQLTGLYGSVTSLILTGIELAGPLPDELFQLTLLETLQLDAANAVGTLSTRIGQLTNLRRLYLNENQFSGALSTLSDALNQLTKLQYLDLSDNDWTGTLPTDDFLFTAVHMIDFRLNGARAGLGGPLPSLQHLRSIEVVELAYNSFAGTLPANFLQDARTTASGSSRASITIDVAGNALTGSLPVEWAQFDTSLIVKAEDNRISDIPAILCLTNWMEGAVAKFGCSAILCPPGSYNVYGRQTNVSGCTSCAASNATTTTTNSYWGQTACRNKGSEISNSSLERRILDELFQNTGGRYWNLTHDVWETAAAPICQREGIFCANTTGNTTSDSGVIEIRLPNYGLRGDIPKSIFQLPQLRRLDISYNPVQVFFDGISQAAKLEVLQASFTKVPQNFSGLIHPAPPPVLSALNLASCSLGGSFPTELLQVSSLVDLRLTNNHLTGMLPSVGWHQLSNLVTLAVDFNDLNGPLPPGMAAMNKLESLDLAANSLLGPLPVEWSMQNWTALKFLNLRGQRGSTKISGALLDFANLTQLVHLDLAKNEMEGSLPADLLAGLKMKDKVNVIVDLSSNQFTGGIPLKYKAFTNMALYLADNRIQNVSSVLCNDGWRTALGYNPNNAGRNRSNSCDFLLCPPHTSAPLGRATNDAVCTPCGDGQDKQVYFGGTDCTLSSADERNALMAFYIATSGDQWVRNDGWGSNDNICTWFGVLCQKNSSVSELRLENNGLTNNVNATGSDHAVGVALVTPNAMAALSPLVNLKMLDIKGNSLLIDFTTDMPTSLTSLRISKTLVSSLRGLENATQLTSLHAMDNGLAGAFPTQLLKLTALKELYLSFNVFAGTVPESISALSKLQDLYLYNNVFAGQLPSSISKMTELRELVLGENRFSGTIPLAYANLSKLEQFSLQNQHGLMGGALPDFSGAVNLWYLDISNNAFGPVLPETLLYGSNMVNKPVTLLFRNNNFTGSIPVSLGKFQQLFIDLSGNRITSIPTSLCTISGWMNGAVAQTKSCDSILCPPGFNAELGRASANQPCSKCDVVTRNYFGQTKCVPDDTERTILVNLFEQTDGINWSRNQFWLSNSPICTWDGISCSGDKQDDRGVVKISLSDTSLKGTLPQQVWNLPFLKELGLRGNNYLTLSLSGIEKAAGTLEVLDVSNTRLQDLSSISKATNLREIYADQTGLYGPFPQELISITTLESLHLNWNFLIGTLPTNIGALNKLKYLHLAGNDFHGSIPSSIGLLTKLEELVLGNCLLSGTLPASELSRLPQLEYLSIGRTAKSGRKIAGPLPAFNKVPMLDFLSLESNELTGSIPSDFLASSTEIQEVVLNHNNIVGEIPVGLAPRTSLRLSIMDNEVSAVPQEYCTNNYWVKESISIFNNSCDALLCAPASANDFGRGVDLNNPCIPCNNTKGAPFYGSTTCDSQPDERAVLVDMFQQLNGPKWYRNDYWLSPTSVCDWYGVMCDRGRVMAINLELNNLRGIFPSQVFRLPKLQMLWLNNNNLQIDFTDIGQAKNLLSLRIESTGFKSMDGIGQATSLTALSIAYNQLTGAFPNELLLLENIRYLNLNSNAFTGPLPASLGTLRYLRNLQLNHNLFNSSLPSFADSQSLSQISMSGNKLTGTIPTDFIRSVPTNLPLRIDLSNNLLEGSIPAVLGRFEQANFSLKQNRFTSLHPSLCNKTSWNGGDVGWYGCDAILCPFGTSSTIGRHSKDNPCISCAQADSQYLGQDACGSSKESSASWRMRNVISCKLAVLLAGLACWILF